MLIGSWILTSSNPIYRSSSEGCEVSMNDSNKILLLLFYFCNLSGKRNYAIALLKSHCLI